jgi:hypothetical protein
MCRLCHSAPAGTVVHGFPYQLQGKAEASAYLAAVETQRARFEAEHTAACARALMALGEEAAAQIERQGTAGAATDIFDGDPPEALKDVYRALFRDVIPHFAAETYGGLKEYLPPLRKDEADLWLQLAETFTAEHMPRLARLASGTLRDLVKAVIDDALEEGLTVYKAATRLREQWPDLARYEADRITRTELIAASNYGSQEGAKATGLPMDKLWISTSDARTREAHLEANDQRVPIDAPFIVDGEACQYPGDPALSAGNRVHCRCAVGYDVTGG